MFALRTTARRYAARVGAPAPAQLQRTRAVGTRAYAAAETGEPAWTKSTLPGPPPPPPTEAATAEAAAAVDEATSEWSKRVFRDAVKAHAPRNDWTREEISAIYHQPLMELVQQAVSCPLPFPLAPFTQRTATWRAWKPGFVGLTQTGGRNAEHGAPALPQPGRGAAVHADEHQDGRVH